MTGEPRVSVILPAFRAADDLPRAIARLEEQHSTDVEIVIVDDGSGDDTGRVATELAAAHDRVRAVLLPENVGVARARQAGVEAARGEWLWFVDADDEWADDALRVLVAMASARDVDVVVAAATLVTAEGRRRALRPPVSPPVSGRDAFRMLLRGEVTGHLWNKLFRRTVMAQASFAPARVQSDLVMVADALSHARSVAFTDVSVYEYRLRPGSLITSVSRRAESLAVIDEAMARAAARLGLRGSDDYRYFRARYVALSGIKDALRADYRTSEQKLLLSRNRRILRAGDLALFVRRHDPRRALLALTAKMSTRAHRVLLAIADR